jgi:hypothetical protein
LTESDINVPDERELLATVKPVPVVKESQLKVVVYAAIASVKFVTGLVSPDQATVVAGTIEVQVGGAPAPPEIKNCPLLPAVEFGIKAPENCKLPTTSSF